MKVNTEGGFISKREFTAIRNYRDTVFRRLFGEKQELLSLYNAINGTHYKNPEDLQIVTLENAVYMSMKNDLAFLIDFQLHLYEHQSTANPNMPLRFLQYVTREYEKLIDGSLLYRGRRIQIPAPHFVVFYNGIGRQPEMEILKLSDAFMTDTNDPQLELKVKVLNINSDNNSKLMNQCRTLKEYAKYVECVRHYASSMDIHEAVSKAVDTCIREGILAEFLQKNKAEVISMSIFEYDEEKVLAMIRQDEHEDGFIAGKTEGKIEAIMELLADFGTVPPSLEQQIRSEKSPDLLSKWHKLAARAASLEQFEKQIHLS